MIEPAPKTNKGQIALDRRALWKCVEARLESSLPGWRKRIDALDQVAAVEARSAGRTWSDDEVFKGVLLAVLSANTDWSRIERIQDELAELFSAFSLETYAETSQDDIGDRFLPWFTARKAGSVALERSLVGLIDTARILLAYSRTHGRAEGYFTSLVRRCDGDPKRAALGLGCQGEFKLPSLGVPLAAEALKNLGFDVAKPDRHVMRAVGAFGLVRFTRWADNRGGNAGRAPPHSTSKNSLLAVMSAVEEISEAAGKPVVLVDNSIWLLGAKSGLYLTNAELAMLAHEAHPADDQERGLESLIRSWMNEDDGGEHRETIEHLAGALDEDRLSDRKHFPEELKGKSW